MISVGKKIKQPNEQLIQISIDRLYKGLTNSDSELYQKLSFLRTLQGLDNNKYRAAKLELPYFVCAQFHPSIRKKNNFSKTNYFILDLDHLHQFDRSVPELKNELRNDEQILLMFASPSNDGLKVMFKFKSPITDAMYYSLFYKIFAGSFTKKYGLEGIVDIKTNDVSRCCFMSYDLDTYYNPNPALIDPAAYTNGQDINLLSGLHKELKELEKEHKTALDNVTKVFDPNTSLPDTILQQIKQRINPNLRTKPPKKEHFQPIEIDEIIVPLEEYLNSNEIKLLEVKPISYGKQLRMAADKYWAEVNLFYGKKGFTVVKTSKTGSSAELAEICAVLIRQFLYN